MVESRPGGYALGAKDITALKEASGVDPRGEAKN